MRPHFHNLAAVRHNNEIGAADDREAMGDHQRRVIVPERLQRLVNQALIDGIQIGGSFIQNDDGRRHGYQVRRAVVRFTPEQRAAYGIPHETTLCEEGGAS